MQHEHLHNTSGITQGDKNFHWKFLYQNRFICLFFRNYFYGIIFLTVFAPVDLLYSFELKTKHATISYSSKDNLREFNNKLYMGRLKNIIKKRNPETIEDEVKHKINLICEKAQTILSMYPPNLKFKIVIHPSTEGIKRDFMRIYKKRVNYIAFYSPKENTVFFSANNAKLRVVAHEIGHVVAENYFAISPPPKIHEVMAQYVETHITQ